MGPMGTLTTVVILSSARSHPLFRLLLLLGGLILGIGLVILLLRSVNLNQLGSDFNTVDYTYLALAVVPFLINLLLKVPRWALLFGEDAPDWDTLFGAMTVGYAINALLPLRVGELVRAYWTRDRAGIGMVQTLSTIALERVTDGVTLIVLLVFVAPTVAFPSNLLGSAVTLGALFVIAMITMIVLAVLASREDHPVSRFLDRMESGWWGIVGRAVRQGIRGLLALRDRRSVVLLLIYTVVIWGSNSLLVWLVLRAFHLNVPLTAGILLTCVLNLGMAVPSTPGYLGVFDYLMVVTLGLYGVHQTPALAASLAFHAIAFVPVTLIGLAYIARTGVQATLQMVQPSESQ